MYLSSTVMEKVTLVIEGLLVELKIPPPSLQTELLLNVTEVRVGLLPSVLCIAMLGVEKSYLSPCQLGRLGLVTSDQFLDRHGIYIGKGGI